MAIIQLHVMQKNAESTDLNCSTKNGMLVARSQTKKTHLEAHTEDILRKSKLI